MASGKEIEYFVVSWDAMAPSCEPELSKSIRLLMLDRDAQGARSGDANKSCGRSGDTIELRIGDGAVPQIGDGAMPRVGDGTMPQVGDGTVPQVGDGITPRVSGDCTPHSGDTPALF